MQTELSVSLLRGRRIVDYRAVRRGTTFRVPRERPRKLERITRLDDAELSDLVIDYHRAQPVVMVPAEATGELASGPHRIAAQPGQQTLAADARGWFSFGDATVLVQRAPAPRPVPRAILPREVRRWISLADREILPGLAFALAVEMVAFMAIHQQPELPADPEIPDESVAAPIRFVLPPPVSPPPVIVAKPLRPAPAPHRLPAAAPSRDAVVAQVQKEGLLRALASLGPDLTAPGLSPDITAAFDHVHRETLAQDVPDGPRTIGGGHEIASLGPLPAPGGPRPEGIPEPPEHLRPPKVFTTIEPSPEPPTPEDADDIQAVARAIRARKGSIQRCYEEALKLNPSLAGKMTIQFDVIRSGRVATVSFPESRLPDDRVLSCITLAARSWSLTQLHDHDALSVAFPFVFASAQER
jgi:hypothetical protein